MGRKSTILGIFECGFHRGDQGDPPDILVYPGHFTEKIFLGNFPLLEGVSDWEEGAEQKTSSKFFSQINRLGPGALNVFLATKGPVGTIFYFSKKFWWRPSSFDPTIILTYFGAISAKNGNLTDFDLCCYFCVISQKKSKKFFLRVTPWRVDFRKKFTWSFLLSIEFLAYRGF